jgi:hypothetical protein
VKAADVSDYLNREWDRVREVGEAYLTLRKRALGPVEGLRLSDELRKQAIASHPEFPGRRERERDLRAHARVAELLRNAEKTRRR